MPRGAPLERRQAAMGPSNLANSPQVLAVTEQMERAAANGAQNKETRQSVRTLLLHEEAKVLVLEELQAAPPLRCDATRLQKVTV